MRVRVQLVKTVGLGGWNFTDVKRWGKEVHERDELGLPQ